MKSLRQETSLININNYGVSMNALDLQNEIRNFAKSESLSFKEAIRVIKEVDGSLKLIKVRAPLIESITLETSAAWPTATLTVEEFLTVMKGTDREFEKEKSLHTDAQIKELLIKFVDGTSCKYTARSTSSSGNPCQEICGNIKYLVHFKFDTAWA